VSIHSCHTFGVGVGVVLYVGVAVAVAFGVHVDGFADGRAGICVVSYQNCDLNLVLTKRSIWPDAIPRSDPFDYAIAIKAFASTNPPHPNRSVEGSDRSLA